MLIGYAERLMLVAPWGFGAQLVFQRLSLMYTKSPWVLVEIYHHCSFGHSERSDLRDKISGSTNWTRVMSYIYFSFKKSEHLNICIHSLPLDDPKVFEIVIVSCAKQSKAIQQRNSFKQLFVYCTSDHMNIHEYSSKKTQGMLLCCYNTIQHHVFLVYQDQNPSKGIWRFCFTHFPTKFAISNFQKISRICQCAMIPFGSQIFSLLRPETSRVWFFQ